ncbi:MAG: hypothetical protein LBE38_10470 [Deltaproteobacteria bacterium]|nr:hypothetical protein [Deltaproteobacteria bacterium]
MGDTIPDEDQATLDAKKTSYGISAFVKAARAVHFKTGEKIGICQAAHTNQGGYFSGNWLNYVTQTRMDVIRKILYGGTRRVDNNNQTLLESSYVPMDSHVWGTDVMADNRWSTDTPLTNYYDISKYTPFPKPVTDGAHYFARVRNTQRQSNQPDSAVKPWPTLEFVLDAKLNMGSRTLFKSHIVPTGKGRYYDWVLQESPNPGTQNFNDSSWVKNVNVIVEVCRKNYVGENENCFEYPNGNVKPIGLLQKNGQNDQMVFGLLTNTYTSTTRKQGGVIRNHIDKMEKSIDLNTGIIRQGGLIAAIDSLTIAGHNDYPSYTFNSAISWGNPMGEMLFEAVRYFARIAQGPSPSSPMQPTADYKPGSEDNFTSYLWNPFGTGARPKPPFPANWNSGTLPTLAEADCAKPIILLIGETDSDFDGDNKVNGSNDLTRPILSTINSANASALPNFNLTTYLQAITNQEKFNDGTRYFYPASYSDDCKAKTLTSLSQVKGMCPNNPAFEGTYSSSAVAYYAHTHNFSTGANEMPIDIYAVTMSVSFPALDFPVYNADGTVRKKISILPASMSWRDVSTTRNRIIGFVNYYILEWVTDTRGTPYHVKFKVNYEDAAQGADSFSGSDWDMDILMEHSIDLVTTAATSTSKRTTTTVPLSTQTSGALKVKGGTYYYFKTPNNDTFAIEPSEVVGLVISSWKAQAASTLAQMMGYTISGTTHDGTYMDYGHRNRGSGTTCTAYDAGTTIGKYGTPKTCNWPAGYGSTTANGTGCLTAFGTCPGLGNSDTPRASYEVWRTFEFNNDLSTVGEYLPNPMYLAAKYGNFTDYNRNGLPDAGEWEGTDGKPRGYFEAKNISDLPAQLEAAFRDIARSISTGTATSASIDTILGGGVSVQTLYYPQYVNPANSTQTVRWVGSVFGLFVDKWGNLREDSNGDGILTTKNLIDGTEGDYIITFSSTKTETASPPNCYSFGNFISRCVDVYGNNKSIAVLPGTRGHPISIHQISPLFDTGYWLSRLDNTKILSGPRPTNSLATISNGQRRIFYGKPTANPQKPTLAIFDNSAATLADLNNLLLYDNYLDQLPDSGTKAQATKRLVEWILGVDYTSFRSRQVGDPWTNNSTLITWRLGDVINSKPILVGAPISNYDLLYGDRTYNEYRSLHAGRRQMAYFGANDGMLHAINIGFYGSLQNGQVSFTKYDPKDPSAKEHEMGAELWGFIPTSVLPHLQWLPDPQYVHAFYVDLKPLINDIKLPSSSSAPKPGCVDHPENGDSLWRTVLIGGLRMGGRPIETPNSASAFATHYYSEIFALDITCPEEDPKLLWRFSSLEMGMTIGLPTILSHDGNWYAVIPSGPITDTPQPGNPSAGVKPYVEFGSDSPYAAYSNQKATLFILNAITGEPITTTNSSGQTIPLGLQATEERSFFNNPFLPRAQISETPWTNHTVYYGLTQSHNHSTGIDSGAVYRLQTVKEDGTPLPPQSWQLRRFFFTDRPVTGAVNSSYDTMGNLWVFFGTGRLWSEDDVQPCTEANTTACKDNHQQYLYGIKEELNAQGFLTFKDRTADANKLIDVSGVKVFRDGTITNITPTTLLTNVISGSTTYANLSGTMKQGAAIGYKRKLEIGKLFTPSQPHSYEMIITQPKLFSMGGGKSLMAFTSFEPKESGCGDNGEGFLYLVDTFTGLPEPSTHDSFYSTENPPAPTISREEVLGVLQTGEGTPTEAFVIVSAAGVTVSASAPDASTASVFLPLESGANNRLTSWKEVLNMGFSMPPSVISQGLDD